MKRSLTSFINTVSDAFYIPPEDDDEPIFVDRLQAIIYTMGCDPVTFLVDPDSEEYAAWNKSMSLETHQQDIDLLLSGNEKLVKNRENLVPSQVGRFRSWSQKVGLTLHFGFLGFRAGLLVEILVPHPCRDRAGCSEKVSDEQTGQPATTK